MLAELLFECVLGIVEAVFECVLCLGDILLDGLFQFSSLSGTSTEKRTEIPRRSWWLPERTSKDSNTHGESTHRG